MPLKWYSLNVDHPLLFCVAFVFFRHQCLRQQEKYKIEIKTKMFVIKCGFSLEALVILFYL